MRMPYICAGVTAAAVLLGINAYRKRNLRKNITTGELKIDNTGNHLPVNADVMDSTSAIGPGQYSLRDIQPAHRLNLTEKLAARYPGFKNFEMKVPVTQQ